MARRPKFTGKDSDYWLLREARKFGVNINLKELTPEYYERQRERRAKRRLRKIEKNNKEES